MADPQFDPKKPFGRVFHGEGKPRKADLECAYFQDGLYFNQDGLLVRNDHNESVIRSRTKAEAPPPVEHRSAAVTDKLLGESDEVVFKTAIALTRKLAKEGKPVEYEPELANRDDNIRFIDENS